MNRGIPELLAPVGSFESLKAAVENGADAVYLGSGKFNARGYAPNFDQKELLLAIDFAHQRDVAAYVTVNTLIKNHELEDAAIYLELLCSHGADAAIIQDTGLLELLTEQFPELPIHASTQMTVHNSAGAELMEKIGARRVVLAREMSLEEIRTVRKNSAIQLEVFIHGALCICYSGRCLMSSFIGGRSGNRGYCAQPCRKKYRQSGGEGDFAYLLSPKDLNLSSRIREIIEAGVDSLKIEGRMKRPEYVAVVTGTYRDILDRLSDDPEASVTPEAQRRLETIFNRGFTEAYLHGRPGSSLMSMRMPGNRGTRLGIVKGYDEHRRAATVLLEAPLHLGDGVAAGGAGTTVTHMWISGREAKSALPGSTVTFPFKNTVLPGSVIFKTSDFLLARSAGDTFRSVHRKVPLDIEVEARKGRPLLIRMRDGHGNTAEALSDVEISIADKHPLVREALQKQIARLGDTVFYPRNLTIRMDDDIFIPVGSINSIRRACLDRLILLRAARYRRSCKNAGPGTNNLGGRDASSETSNSYASIPVHPLPRPVLSIRVSCPGAVEAAVSKGADRVYLDLAGAIQNRSKTNAVIREAHAAGSTVFIRLPDIIKDPELEQVCSALDEMHGYDGILAAGPDQVFMLKNRYSTAVAADYPINACNHKALQFIERLGAVDIAISPELTLDEIKAVTSGHNIECLVQGAIQLMISEQCIPGAVNGCSYNECSDKSYAEKSSALGRRQGNCSDNYRILDEKGFEFPIRCDNMCRTHIFNSRELCMIDRIPDLIKAGVSSLRIEGILYNNEQIKETTMLYRQAIDAYPENWAEFDSNEALSRIKAIFPQGLTTGHYFRGVQ